MGRWEAEMSIYITGYTEALILSKWHCIDFYQHDASGKLHIVPCITGQSFVRQALEWDCNMQNLMGVPAELSDEVRKECTGPDGILYGAEEQRWHYWYIIDGNWFERVNFSIPESCGFLPRQEISNYQSNPDEYAIDIEQMISVKDYQKLDGEAKKAYQYFEYTDSSGNRAILQEFKQAVMDRITAYNRHVFWEDKNLCISVKDVRVLILEE